MCLCGNGIRCSTHGRGSAITRASDTVAGAREPITPRRCVSPGRPEVCAVRQVWVDLTCLWLRCEALRRPRYDIAPSPIRSKPPLTCAAVTQTTIFMQTKVAGAIPTLYPLIGARPAAARWTLGRGAKRPATSATGGLAGRVVEPSYLIGLGPLLRPRESLCGPLALDLLEGHLRLLEPRVL